MAILFPSWATPVLDIYNLPWPDIDEDTVLELGTKVEHAGAAVEEFVTSVHAALEELASHTESAAFGAYVEEWGSVAAAFIAPIKTTTGLAPGVANVAFAAITTLKTSLLTVLAAQIATTFAGGPVSAAVRLAARQVIEAAVEEAVKLAISSIVNAVNSEIETLIVTPLKGLVDGAVTGVSFNVKQVVVDATPSLDISFVSDRTVQLAIDIHDVTTAVAKIKKSYDGISAAVGALLKWHAGSGYIAPAPFPDTSLRDVLKPVLDHLVETVHNEIDSLGHQVISKLTKNLTDTWERLSSADAVLSTEAQRLRRIIQIPPPVPVYLVDRTLIPQLINIERADDPVRTGNGYSDAGRRAETVVIERAPEPVITGPAESDAHDQIQQIVIERAPEPVTTGPAESDARDQIQQIVLPRADGSGRA